MTHTFPESFSVEAHGVVDGATHWKLNHPKTGNIVISIVGGGYGLYGDGINTFEMYDLREDEPRGYLSIDEINEHLKNNPL